MPSELFWQHYHYYNYNLQGSQEEWRTIFFLVVGLILFAAVIYGVFSTSELVAWADESDEQNTKEDDTLESNKRRVFNTSDEL